jgi:hypothetical protein
MVQPAGEGGGEVSFVLALPQLKYLKESDQAATGRRLGDISAWTKQDGT